MNGAGEGAGRAPEIQSAPRRKGESHPLNPCTVRGHLSCTPSLSCGLPSDLTVLSHHHAHRQGGGEVEVFSEVSHMIGAMSSAPVLHAMVLACYCQEQRQRLSCRPSLSCVTHSYPCVTHSYPPPPPSPCNGARRRLCRGCSYRTCARWRGQRTSFSRMSEKETYGYTVRNAMKGCG